MNLRKTRQLESLVHSHYQMDQAASRELVAKLVRDTHWIEEWVEEFESDLYEGTRGYPPGKIRETPELEDTLVQWVEDQGSFSKRIQSPTLCLSHDIDYLRSTFVMGAKELVGYGRVKGLVIAENYLSSIRKMAEYDRSLLPESERSTFFLACPLPSSFLRRRPIQWLIDPSYRFDSAPGRELISILRENQCEIGLHGSYFSLVEDSLTDEREALEKALGQPVKVGRQHWLNLPGEQGFRRLARSGIAVDSTLGWNGKGLGFRGGWSRPFPIWAGDQILWEVPLALMDGPLFLDQKLSESEVFDRARQVLEKVYERQGCVALNWHDRSANPRFNWFGAYQRIVEWALERGFRLRGIGDSGEECRF